LLLAIGAAAQAQPPFQPPAGEADLILTGGAIYTPAGWAEAVAIQSGVIIAVGDDAAIRARARAGTETVDLGGAAVFPGLHDMHVHPAGGGSRGCAFPQGSPLEVVQATIAACIAERQPGEWITGGQWDA
jgi:predicted amidohydrolase YtcJ